MLAQPAPAESLWTYRAVPGDNLYTFAHQYLAPGIGWQRLQRYNQIEDPMRLMPGTDLRMPVAWLRAEAAVAKVVYITGQARRETADGGNTVLALGDELRSKDLLITDSDAAISLRLADSTRVMIGGDARVLLESLLVLGRSGVASTRIRVEQGEADSQVNPQRQPATRYEIQAPSLNLGVRGTAFRVRVDPKANATLAEVTQGRVGAKPHDGPGPGPELRIGAGFGVIADAAGKPPQVRPLLPAPALAALPTVYERIPLAIAWPAVAGATGYRTQVFADPALEQRLRDTDTRRALAQWSDLPDGHYWLLVRARDAQQLEGLSTTLAFTLQARPEPPFASTPRPDARVSGSTVELAWTRPESVRRYRLQVSDDERFETPRIDRNDLALEQLALPLPPGRYHWRLASINEGGKQGPFGDPMAFELRETPPPPALDAPQTQGEQLMFRWPERTGSDSYEVQLARDPEFRQLVLEQQVERPELTIDKPPAGTYHLRVRTTEAEGEKGPYGATQQFDVSRGLWWWWVPAAALLLLL